jgi:His/Glu/Gln/Arg/opine family amino acid ABC transporter permease subunit
MIETAVRPRRDVAWFRRESTPVALAAAVLGGVGLSLVIVGGLAVVTINGWTPLESLVTGLRSAGLRGVLAAGVVLGLGAIALGWSTYRRMPSKLAREESIAGVVLGVQAAALGGLAFWVTTGDVERIARNFLNFVKLEGHGAAFLNGAKNTIILAATGEAIGVLLGLVLAVFLSSKRKVVRAPARAYVNFFRGTPLLWQLTAFYSGMVLGLDLGFSVYTSGIIIFGLNTAAYAAEVFRAGIQSIERGQLEAARGLGMSYLQAMRYAVLPQAVRRVIPPLTNEFVILIKDTSLIIFLGLSERNYELMSVGQSGYANSFNATFFVATAFGYLAITLPLIRAVNVIERRLRSGLVGVTGG